MTILNYNIQKSIRYCCTDIFICILFYKLSPYTTQSVPVHLHMGLVSQMSQADSYSHSTL